MKLELRRGTGTNSATVMYDDSKCTNADMSDHRFGSTNDPSIATQLDEWTESYTAGTPNTRIVWVKTNGNSTIYFFANHETASLESNGDNTFIFFDDFPGTSLDTDKWTHFESSAGTGDVTVGSGA
ncbi:MAG: DUF2341 domain-containing protein, partial [candidate division WOR-3 bacterium]|nr:DUF2341 domain-containing protein [candidate division WOR-3 bacterium]